MEPNDKEYLEVDQKATLYKQVQARDGYPVDDISGYYNRYANECLPTGAVVQTRTQSLKVVSVSDWRNMDVDETIGTTWNDAFKARRKGYLKYQKENPGVVVAHGHLLYVVPESKERIKMPYCWLAMHNPNGDIWFEVHAANGSMKFLKGKFDTEAVSRKGQSIIEKQPVMPLNMDITPSLLDDYQDLEVISHIRIDPNRLVPEEEEKILRLLKAGILTQTEIANIFSVKQGTISKLKTKFKSKGLL